MTGWDVRSIDPVEIEWPFRSGQPQWRAPSGSTAVLDPVPAYQHDRALVEVTLEAVSTATPTPWPGTVWLAPNEETGRTNGWSSYRSERVEDSDAEFVRWGVAEGVIFLSAKRIPPHPAVTRYVVAHEYGHQVNYLVAERQSVEYTDVARDYAAMRGIEWSADYGAGTWHRSATEVLACDFRIVVAGVEPDYWPHPGIERPGPDVERWWSDALADHQAAA